MRESLSIPFCVYLVIKDKVDVNVFTHVLISHPGFHDLRDIVKICYRDRRRNRSLPVIDHLNEPPQPVDGEHSVHGNVVFDDSVIRRQEERVDGQVVTRWDPNNLALLNRVFHKVIAPFIAAFWGVLVILINFYIINHIKTI